MLVFLSITLFAQSIDTKRNFANQNKGKITLKIFSSGRMNLDMRWGSGLFHLENVANKRVGVPSEKKSINLLMVNAIT